MERSLFRHMIETRVRSYHVDAQSIVHNAWYLFFFEEARVEYFRQVNMVLDERTIREIAKFQIVRNSCDYKSPALFDDIIRIWTRVAYVKNSSLGIEHRVDEKEGGRLIAEGTGVAVYLDAATNRPVRLPDLFREKIRAYEGENVKFLA